MDAILKVLVATACVAVIAAVGLYFYKEKKVIDQAALQRQAAHMATLDRERCASMAEATIPDSPGKPALTQQFNQDLKLCQSLNLLGAYEEHQLQLAGVF